MKKLLVFVAVLGCVYGFAYKQSRDIDIQLSYIDSPLINIHWCGSSQEDDDTVLALTSKGSVYRSTDKGRTWAKMSEIFHRKALVELENSDDRVGIVNSIVASPIDSQLVLFTGTEQVSWLSLDCGRSISVISAGKPLREFSFHPLNRDWMLAAAWNKCGADDFGKPCVTYKEMLLSQDTGVTWHNVAQYINQFSWGIKNEQMAQFIPQERILASFEPSGKGHQSLSTWNMDANLYYSDDFFQTRTLSVPSGARFLLTESYLFVAKVTSAFTQEVSLLVSNPTEMLGYQYETIDASEKLREHSYTILDTAEAQVFMIVNHLKPSSPMGLIYISDSTGTRYTESLPYAVRLDGGAEFHRVQGLEGIYISNVYASEQAQLYERQVFESQEEGGFALGQQQQGFKDEDLKKYKQTRVTFDKGAQWVQLKPPTIDSNNHPIKCDPKQCSLHLHLNQQFYQFAPIYSQQDSIGIVVATGSIGKYLSYRPDQVNTYLSRDGGLTWVEMHKGSHIYEISDHGGLIVMASDQKATSELKYSWNEGMTWNTIQFTDDEVEVQNIITEPTNKATRFIAYGTAKVQSNGQELEQGILVTVDLDELHPRKCSGTDRPGDGDSDYELWTPSGLINPECLFGKKVTYMRRKRDSQCYNPETFDKVVSVESCPCSPEDYECDIGFVYQQQQCIPINGTLVTQPPSDCASYYTLSSGYRKIAGDMCQGGLEHQQLRLACPGTSSSSIFDWLLMLLVGLAIYWLYGNFEYVKEVLASASSQANNNHSQNKSLKDKLMEQLKMKEQMRKDQKKDFKAIDLEENERPLGHQEFDEDLLEQEDQHEEQLEVVHQEQELI